MQITYAQFLHYLLCTDIARVDFANTLLRGDPLPDMHKDVREAIVDMHRRELDQLATSSYGREDGPPESLPSPVIVAGYQAFLRSAGTVTWFEPPLRVHDLGSLSVVVDPEMGLVINAVPHVIKLYLSRDPLPTGRRTMTLALLNATFSRTWPGVTFGVLDVRRGKLHTYPERGSTLNPKLMVLMEAEAEGLYALSMKLHGLESAVATADALRVA